MFTDVCGDLRVGEFDVDEDEDEEVEEAQEQG